MSERVKQAMSFCKKNKQEHLLEYLTPIFSDKSNRLANQILKTDFKKITDLYQMLVLNGNETQPFAKDSLTPMKSTDAAKLSKEKRDELSRIGIEAIQHGEVAVITMAGGQGTRLGHDGPKGTFILGTKPRKSLFEIQSDRLRDIQAKTGIFIPWLIMTSEENSNETIKFFEKNQYFGYDPSKIQFFTQEMIPVIDLEGKVLVNGTGLVTAPNGNGGLFSTLVKTGKYKWLKEQGIKAVFVCGIDNVLVKVADPLFIGFAIQSKTEIACKSTSKRSYDEKAGVFCYKNDKPSYVEYTEIPDEKAKAVDKNGKHLFGDIGIVMYVFQIDFLDKISKFPLPYHIAKKKTAYMLPDGDIVHPAKPNSIKFETFIFDSFEIADNIELLRVSREEEFAPVKNKEGEDSPDTASALYNKQYGD